MRTFAVLGGTFDPVHCGHLRVAIEVRERLGLDAVELLPAPAPRLRDTPAASTAQRIEMLNAAISSLSGLGVNTLEVDTARDGEATRTVDTLRALRARHEHSSIGFIVGADAFSRLHKWHEFEVLPSLAHLLVVGRPGSELPRHGPVADLLEAHRAPAGASMACRPCGYIFEVETPHLDISASQIRNYLVRGRSIDLLTPPAVLEVIERDHTYQHAT